MTKNTFVNNLKDVNNALYRRVTILNILEEKELIRAINETKGVEIIVEHDETMCGGKDVCTHIQYIRGFGMSQYRQKYFCKDFCTTRDFLNYFFSYIKRHKSALKIHTFRLIY